MELESVLHCSCWGIPLRREGILRLIRLIWLKTGPFLGRESEAKLAGWVG